MMSLLKEVVNMLKSNERLCKCGCGQIININDSHIMIKNTSRNSYYANKYHLPKMYKGIEDWAIEQGFIKVVKGVCQ